ncbi:MAG: hypothetical protein NMK33_04955 [Candidatus Cardinium sp.]|uniref:hypothetical protein n=1 Tax=Cardinium endosymbiont of Dermatophagoides farinae TaxID=2597823 RepID=UPI00118376F2|nr:hypothetical protein [Cardinium endosymbiont of Dermatophagoides farinae]TSJ80768.1 hypothetical protein FPG78_01730 [Cardinium endosymbiont of Dermatophagoides farinae]UWW96772.1 MAG: hypothetical protein NMK33_04955 [Candidatus Cardinium sp.]
MSFNILPFVIILILLLLKSSFTKERLSKLKPSDAMMALIGCYVICTTILDYASEGFIYWYLLQFITAISLIGYAIDSKKEVPSWKIGRRWLISVVFCLPINVLWNWSGLVQAPSVFALALSVAHLTLTLFVLPLRISVRLVSVMLLVIIYAISRNGMGLLLSESGVFLISLLGLSLMIFFIIVYNKRKLASYKHHGHYLKSKIQEKQLKEQEEQQSGFDLYSDLETVRNNPMEAHTFIDQVMKEATQFISYLDSRPLYKEDLDLITNNFVIWDIFLKQRARSRNHIILIPVEVSLDELVRKLEVALDLESKTHPIPKLLIEPKDHKLPEKIICDANQMVSLLIMPVILSIASLDSSKDRFVTVQLYTTYLKYEPRNPAKDTSATDGCFPAIALVIGNAVIPQEALPKIKSYYQDVTVGSEFSWHSVVQKESEWTSMEKRSIERIVRIHYGYLQFPASHKRPILIVVPCNVAAVRDEMISRILPSDPSISYREFKESMVTLTKAYNNLCTVADMRTIVLDELFLLVRRCYGFRRHASGQLFYVRALDIAQLVAEWVPYQPRPVYFSVLYGLVRYAGLPLAYVKANYSMDVYHFVESIVAVNKRQEMEPCGLYIGNRLKRIINREQLFVLCIKFAERLYDLRHAKDYIHLEEVKYMAQETLTIDIELGKKYLNAKIVEELVQAANQALEVCEGTC